MMRAHDRVNGTAMPIKPASSACPCGSARSYAACCELVHNGEPAITAEALMRSRYCAYVLGLERYLLATWHASTRPASLRLDDEPQPKWLGLEVRRHVQTGDDAATVEFIARYKTGGRAHRLHEISRFRRDGGRWYYVDGEFPA